MAVGRGSDSGETVCALLGHPLRVQILALANEQEISAVQFVNRGLAPQGVSWKTEENALSNVAYHFRALEKAGYIKAVRRVQRRGATEHIHRGAVAILEAQDGAVDLADLSRARIRGLLARTERAAMTDTLDSRNDRHITMMALELDRRGWREFIGALDACHAEVERISDDARDRLANSGAEVIPATFGMLGFESPLPIDHGTGP